MTQFIPYGNLTPDLHTLLNNYIDEEFGQVAFVQQRSWATPDWSVVLEESGEVATFCNLIERTVNFDGKCCKVAGLNNVITPKKYRGKGYSSKVLRETQTFLFNQLQADYGLLLCADDLVPFYSRLGWYLVESTLVYDQPQGQENYDSNIMLLVKENAEQAYPTHIDLMGLPW